MRLLSPRLLVVLAVVVVAWGGIHLLGSQNVAVTPAVWPVADPSASPVPAAAATASVAATPTPSPAAAIPVLPGAMQQLNGSTRDTAVGLYAVIEQLEEALRIHFDQLVKQLEPGG
jgi:hypothetical protein